MKWRDLGLPGLTLIGALAVATLPLASPTANAATTSDVITSYQPTVNETIDASGFKHPGVGLTKDVLENMRTQVRALKEPWNTYFNQMLLSGAASTSPAIANVSASDSTKPRYYGLNSQGVESIFIKDALTAYTQAILYYVTGNETYRANALRIIRLYEQMDPSQFAYYTDAHIHTGIPLQRMVGAAEILRYTSYQTASLAWTDDDTNLFLNNFVLPTINTDDSSPDHFMNQHLYTTIGAMSGYIFAGDRANYNKTVEWFTVNKVAADQGQNGAIKALFRLVTRNDDTGEEVTPAVQHVEMGRDQAHGAGDITNTEILARMLMAQGTKVDPVDGTASTAPNAVGPYEFLDDRILHAAEQFGAYMQGYEIPWIPTASHTDAYGNPTVVYHKVAGAYRGRLTQNTWELYYYYQYTRGVNMAQVAPNFTRLFANRTIYNWDGGDGGGDFWLFIPAAAAAEGSQYLVKTITDPLREVEVRFTPLDANSVAMTDATASYIRTTATAEGSKLAVYGYANGSSSIALKIRTNGVATMQAFGDSIQLPDTGGQWMYLPLAHTLGDFLPITIVGNGTTVDFDHINIAGSDLSVPSFSAGNADLSINTYSGSTLPVTANFAATDSSASATVSYQVDNLPPGATFNSSTGAFTWSPTQAGTYSFVVEARDGTSVATKRVTVVVSADRQSAVNAVIAPYNAALPYVTSTVATYQAAYNDIEGVISSASDDVFFQKLATLKTAVAGLQLLTPVISDGSLDYTNMLVSSTFGSQVPNALDNNPDSFVGYYLAQNQTHTLDFGPNFKVAATSFGLQVRTSFPERIGGTTVYGSNDNATWTRLTPGLTAVTEDMQNLPVESDLQNQRFRFLKIAMIQPSSSMLELSEFHIFGTRYETVNKLSAVTLISDQALKKRIIPGNTIKLNFVATEPINNVTATIQGLPATVTTTDNLNWTATLVTNAATPTGTVKFLLNYKTASGQDAEPTFFTTDSSSLFIADQSDYISNLMSITALSDSSGRTGTDIVNSVGTLFDSNLGSVTDMRVNGSGYGAWVEFDFKGGGSATLSHAEVIARQDQYSGRINGTVLQGSNDNTNWDTISNAAGNTADWQTLTINSATPYRYIRVFNGNNWYGNMAELRLYGATQSIARIGTASLSSAQAVLKRIVPGNTVTLNFTAKTAISNVTATIQGQHATVSTTDGINYTATVTLAPNVTPGPVTFAVNYTQQDGAAGYPATETTDGTSLTIADQTNNLSLATLSSVSTMTDSSGRNATDIASSVANLFDSNAATFTDMRVNGSGYGGWLEFDFKAGGAATLSRAEVLARQDQVGRISGVVLQGSNDNTNWTTISTAAGNTADWQTLTVGSSTPYRYVRVYNGNQWFGNMAELRLYGTTASTALISTASITSAQSLSPSTTLVKRIVPGNTVTLKFTAKSAITGVTATIQGQPATVTTTDNINFTATATLPQGVAAGTVGFTVNYTLQDGTAGYPASATTDGSGVYLVDESDVIRNVSTVATLIDSSSTSYHTAAATKTNVDALFDSNIGTTSDFRIGSTNSCVGAYIIFDFKSGNQVNLTTVELLARQDQAGRAKGIVFQGSNDGTTWTTIAGTGASTIDWQTFAVSNPKTPYRYIRIYNGGTWCGNMAEVRLHGSVHAADTSAPVTTDNAPTGTVNQDTAVILTPTDTGGSGVQATYYTVDGGAQQTGTTIALTTDGTHSLVYWSVDWAGNVEQKHTVTVTVDKTAPAAAGLYPDVTAPTNQNVTVSIYYPVDATVREYKLGDTGAWTAYTAPVVVTANTTVYARGTDASGNVSAVSSVVVSNINRVPPAGASFLPSSMDPTAGNVSVAITYPASVVVRQYRVGDAGGWTPYTGPVVVTDNAVVHAQSTDAAGNVSPVTTYAVTNIDRIPPADAQFTASITDPTNKDVLVTVVFPDDAAIKEYRIGENGPWTAYGAPVLMSDNGIVFARGTDAAGNVSNVTQYTVSNIDRIPPVGASLVVDTTAPTNQAVNVTITYPADAAVKEFKAGGGDWTPYTGTVQVANDTTVYARGTDAVGNVSNVTSIVVSNIYKIVPTTSVAMLPESPNGKNSWYTTDVSLTLAVNPGSYGGAVTTEYQVNGGAWTATSGEALTFSEGVYTVAYRSRDQAGNVEQTKSIQFQVDKTAPTLAVALDKSTIWPPNHTMVPVVATLSATDAGSGIESVVLTSITSDKPDSGLGDIHADFGTPSTTFSVRAEKDRVYTVTFTATDKAGNKTVKTATVTVPHDQSGLNH